MYNAKIRSRYAELFKQAEAGLGATFRDQLVKAAEQEPALAEQLKSSAAPVEHKSIFGGRR